MSVSAQQLIHIANKTPDRSISGGAVATTILFDGELRRTRALLLEELGDTDTSPSNPSTASAPPSSHGDTIITNTFVTAPTATARRSFFTSVLLPRGGAPPHLDDLRPSSIALYRGGELRN